MLLSLGPSANPSTRTWRRSARPSPSVSFTKSTLGAFGDQESAEVGKERVRVAKAGGEHPAAVVNTVPVTIQELHDTPTAVALFSLRVASHLEKRKPAHRRRTPGRRGRRPRVQTRRVQLAGQFLGPGRRRSVGLVGGSPVRSRPRRLREPKGRRRGCGLGSLSRGSCVS